MQSLSPVRPAGTGRRRHLRGSLTGLRAALMGAASAVWLASGLAIDVAGSVPSPPTDVRVLRAWNERGPQSSISCPAGAVDIAPGTNIQNVVNGYGGNTAFCLKAGVHYLTGAITPKTGNAFVGEYGAVLDGTNWSTTDPNTGAFRAHNQDIDNVTIRNLVIRNMPQRGIHAFYNYSDGWTIENNEIASNRTGLNVPGASMVRNNQIHHNGAGGYLMYKGSSTTFENNEIAYNGTEQKVVGTMNVTFRGNFVHHNAADGIWYDADNTGALIEGNTVEDNARVGIFYEISGQAVIRHNVVRRSGDNGIFISTSKHVEIHNNTLEDNFRGIQYFVNCDAVGGGIIGWDLANNSAHNNIVVVGTRSGSLGNILSHLGSCTSTQVQPYVNGSKNLVFDGNNYVVPSVTTRYWMWGLSNFKSFDEWRGLGQDTAGVVSQ